MNRVDETINDFWEIDYSPPAKLQSFRELEVGWRFGEGIPTPSNIYNLAIQIDSYIFDKDLFETDYFPGIDGEVSIKIYEENHIFEFTVEVDCSITFVHESNKEETEYLEDLTLNEALSKVDNINIIICESLSDYYIQETGLKRKDDLIAPHLNLLQTGEYPWWTKIAPVNVTSAYVSMPENSTQPLPENLQYIGKSIYKTYQMEPPLSKRIQTPVTNAIITFSDSIENVQDSFLETTQLTIL